MLGETAQRQGKHGKPAAGNHGIIMFAKAQKLGTAASCTKRRGRGGKGRSDFAASSG